MSPVKHARLGASNAHRWLMCPGSVKAEDGFPDKTSPFAEWGTRAHDVAERVLTGSDAAYADCDDQEMCDCVEAYVEYVRLNSEGADDVTIEGRVSYSDWVPGGFGTADAIIIKGDTLHVCDLKTGVGVQVFAEDNPQGMLYALGAYAECSLACDIKTVRISIVQPRLDHISEWEISLDDLLRWAEWVSERAEEAMSEDAPRVPGESQCRWCKAKATCPALAEYTEKIIMSDFDDLDAPSAENLTDDQLSAILSAKPLIVGWLSAIEDHITERLTAGGSFPGYKLVEGRANRQWADGAEQTLVDLMGEDAYAPRKIISPAQAEKALGKARKGEIADLVTKPHGKPTLAKADDPRPAIGLEDGDFDCLQEGRD